METPSKQMQPVTPPAQPATVTERSEGSDIERWERRGVDIRASFDMTREEGMVLATQCLDTQELKTRNVVGQTLELIGVFAHVIEAVDEVDGEVNPRVRCVMLLADGRRVSTTAVAVCDTLSACYNMLGIGPWSPSMLARIGQTKSSRTGHEYCTMQLLGRKVEPGKGAKSK